MTSLLVVLLATSPPLLATHASQAARCRALADQSKFHTGQAAKAKPAKRKSGWFGWGRVTTPPKPAPSDRRPCFKPGRWANGLKVCLPILLLAASRLEFSTEPAPGPAQGLTNPGSATMEPVLLPQFSQATASPLWPEPEAPDEAQVQIMGHGQVLLQESGGAPHRADFGFRVETGPGPAKGFLTYSDRASGRQFTGIARELSVIERTMDGSPSLIRVAGDSGASLAGGFEPFTFMVTAADPGHGSVRLTLQLSGRTGLAIPSAPLATGYVSINGVQQRTGCEGSAGWGGWHSSELGAYRP